MPPSPSSRSLGRRASCSAACGPCCNPPPLRLTRCGGDVSIPTREKPMRVVRWARLQSAAPCGLRLGAWYPVTGLTAREAQVQVRGRVLMVPRSLLELRTTPPLEWTVAPGGTDGARGLARVRDDYLVCPNCRHRDDLPDARVPRMRCSRCNEVFSIAWDERYLRTGQGRDGREPTLSTPPPLLGPDHRMTRRRLSTSRRSRLERRFTERRQSSVAHGLVERRMAERRRRMVRRSGRDRRGGTERRRTVARRSRAPSLLPDVTTAHGCSVNRRSKAAAPGTAASPRVSISSIRSSTATSAAVSR